MKLFQLIPILIVFLITSCNPNEKKRFVRKEIHSTEALDDVRALDSALKIMKSRGCQDPTSWYYQGAIHWIPDSIKNNHFCDSYHNYEDSKLGWRHCTHTPGKAEEIHFLVWHRLYIWHFENIVRRVSGKEDFSLPYWDYTSGDSKKMSLHPLFINKNSFVYEACRFDSINRGFPINGEIERALDVTKLMTYTDYELFNKNINRAPHGAIHDYVGHGNDYNDGKLWFDNPITQTNTRDGLMGWVPTAAFDAVFWTHHANIDRLWQKWSNSNLGQMVTLEMLKSAQWEYVFFDEWGKEVRYTPEQIMDILYTMDYDYDDTKVHIKSNNSVKSTPLKLLSNTTHTTKITGRNTSIDVTDVKSGTGNSVIEIEISYNEIPSGVVEVYLNTNQRSTKSKDFVGYMTFFGEDHKMPDKSCKLGCCSLVNSEGRTKIVYKFQHQTQKDWQFHFYNHNGVITGDLRIDRIKIISN